MIVGARFLAQGERAFEHEFAANRENRRYVRLVAGHHRIEAEGHFVIRLEDHLYAAVGPALALAILDGQKLERASPLLLGQPDELGALGCGSGGFGGRFGLRFHGGLQETVSQSITNDFLKIRGSEQVGSCTFVADREIQRPVVANDRDRMPGPTPLAN